MDDQFSQVGSLQRRQPSHSVQPAVSEEGGTQIFRKCSWPYYLPPLICVLCHIYYFYYYFFFRAFMNQKKRKKLKVTFIYHWVVVEVVAVVVLNDGVNETLREPGREDTGNHTVCSTTYIPVRTYFTIYA